MNEFAPEYTRKERWILLGRTLAIVAPVFLLAQFWFFPWFRGYVEHAACYQYGPVNGLQLSLYGVLVGIPLLTTVVMILVMGPLSLRVLASNQFPPPGQKVWRPTRYVHGWRATLRVWIVVAILVMMLLLGVQGSRVARNILEHSDPDRFDCPDTLSPAAPTLPGREQIRTPG